MLFLLTYVGASMFSKCEGTKTRETLWTVKLTAFVFFTLLSHSSAFQDEKAPFKYFPFFVSLIVPDGK